MLCATVGRGLPEDGQQFCTGSAWKLKLSLSSMHWKNKFFFFFEGVGLYQVACRILVPLPGIETSSLALDVWSLKHWISREVKLNLSSETSCSCQLNAEQVVDEHPLPTPFA